jgi:hypothetical protein
MTTILGTEVPEDVLLADVLTACTPDSGTVAIAARPESRRNFPLLRDLLTATGADLLAVPPPKSMEHLEQVAVARLRTRRAHTILVLLADYLSAPEMRRIHAIAMASSARLVLGYGFDAIDCVRAVVTDLGGDPCVAWADIAPSLPAQAGDLCKVVPVASPFPPEVPSADFPVFRAACRRMLPAEQFDLVDAVYRDAFRHVRNAQLTHAEALEAYLRERLVDTVAPSEGIVIARAVQAAALTNHILVKIDLRALDLMILECRHRSLTDEELVRLWAITSPHVAVACVLTDAGLAQQLAALTTADIRPGGTAHNAVLSPAGLPFLAVLDEFNTQTDVAPDSPLFTWGNRKLTGVIERAATALGLPLWPTMARDTRRTNSWRHQLGLTVVDIP